MNDIDSTVDSLFGLKYRFRSLTSLFPQYSYFPAISFPQTDFDTPMSPKGKCPWITYNDVDVADSQFCIEFLNKEFSVDMNAKLSGEDRAVALAFRKLIEDDLFW